MKESSFYKTQAKELMGEKWKTLALAYLIYMGITMVSSMIPIVSYVAAILIAGPFTFALTVMVMKAVSGNDIEIGEIFSGFDKFVDLLVLYIRQAAIIFLWALCLFVPGIIAGYSYALTYFVYAENPGMTAKQAMDESKRLMDGHRMDLFKVQLQYIGWVLLAPLTLGILGLWLTPQIQAATALFYYDLKAQNPGAYQVNQDYNPGYTQSGYTQAKPIIAPSPTPQITSPSQIESKTQDEPQSQREPQLWNESQFRNNYNNTLNNIEKDDLKNKE